MASLTETTNGASRFDTSRSQDSWGLAFRFRFKKMEEGLDVSLWFIGFIKV